MKKIALILFLSIGSLLTNESNTFGQVTCNSDQVSITVGCVDVQFPGSGPWTKRVCGRQCNWDQVHYSTETGTCTWCENKDPEIG